MHGLPNLKICNKISVFYTNVMIVIAMQNRQKNVFLLVKQYHYRPGQALRVPGGSGSQTSWQSAHEDGKVVSTLDDLWLALRTDRLYLPGNIPGTHFCQRLSWPQCLSAAGRIMQWIILMTPSGIDPATFRLVSQWHLNSGCCEFTDDKFPPFEDWRSETLYNIV